MNGVKLDRVRIWLLFADGFLPRIVVPSIGIYPHPLVVQLERSKTMNQRLRAPENGL